MEETRESGWWRQEGRKERAISRVECNDVSTLLPPLTTFRLILSVRRKRSSRLAISQPVPILANLSWRIRAATLPFTLRLFRPFWHLLALGPSFYHETVPETEETTSRPSQKFIILSLTQQYLRHGSKLESISKKSISNAGIFSSLFLSLLDFISFHPVYRCTRTERGKMGKPGGCCIERISLRIAVAPGHFCAASGVEIIGCR